MNYQLGFDPDLTRPLRNEPVRREEVRIGKSSDDWKLLTMPIATLRLEQHEKAAIWLSDEPNELWKPFWVELEHEWAEYQQQCISLKRRPPQKLYLGFFPSTAREYICVQCNCRYLEWDHDERRTHLCSNHCEEIRQRTLTKAARDRRPKPDYAKVNATRAARRAETRVGRICEHCGVPIEAARSTRRFCSEICRVRWHRANPQAAQ